MKNYSEQLAMCDNSEVFHEFLKTIKAYDNGLENYDDKQVDLGKNPDKKQCKEIEDKYEITLDDEEDGNDLIEKANPDNFEVIDSYLSGAGTYKNNAQNHKITIDNVTKKPTMSNIHSKKVAAINNLTNELVVIAEEMDVRGHSDLVSFADDMIVRISETADAVKKNLTAIEKTAWSPRSLRTTSDNTVLVAKWILGLLGAGVLIHSITKRIDNNKAYPIRVACSSFINSIRKYQEKNRETLDAQNNMALGSVVETISTFQSKYYEYADNFSLLYGKIMETISNPDTDTNNSNVDDLYKQLMDLNTQTDQLSVKMQRPLQNALSNIQNVQEDMENNGGNINGERNYWDATRENGEIIYEALFGTDEQLLADNFNKLITSIDADKNRRSKKLDALKNMISTYKHSDNTENSKPNTLNTTSKSNDNPFNTTNANSSNSIMNKYATILKAK